VTSVPDIPTPPPGPLGARPFTTPIRVLFLCTGNSARSQIAEALLWKKGGSRFVVGSAGASPASEVHPEALAALRRVGIEWATRQLKGFAVVQHQPWDLVITLCDRSREQCAALPGRPVYAHWGVPDPVGMTSEGRVNPFDDALQLLSWRIDLMLAIQAEQLEQAVIEERLRAIGASQPAGDGQPI
jgi:protein-tyrosine-phosphatase